MEYDRDRVKGYYDDYSKTYDTERNNTYYYSFINEIETSFAKKYGESKQTLEIGCGSGIILDQVNKVSASSVGMDLSFGMLSVSSKKGLTAVSGNALSLPFGDESFDLVYSFKVLPHVENLEEVFAEISRVLKPNGVAILEFYNPLSFKGVSNLFLRSGSKVYLKFHSPGEIRVLTSGKFSILEEFGARILLPFAGLMKIPFLSVLISKLEVYLSKTWMKCFAGYYSFVLEKK